MKEQVRNTLDNYQLSINNIKVQAKEAMLLESSVNKNQSSQDNLNKKLEELKLLESDRTNYISTLSKELNIILSGIDSDISKAEQLTCYSFTLDVSALFIDRYNKLLITYQENKERQLQLQDEQSDIINNYNSKTHELNDRSVFDRQQEIKKIAEIDKKISAIKTQMHNEVININNIAIEIQEIIYSVKDINASSTESTSSMMLMSSKMDGNTLTKHDCIRHLRNDTTISIPDELYKNSVNPTLAKKSPYILSDNEEKLLILSNISSDNALIPIEENKSEYVSILGKMAEAKSFDTHHYD